MAISFVNGFMCTSSCDVAKAKKGEDPHPNLHTLNEADEKRGGSLDGPAVVFGGSLAERSQAVSGVDAAGRAEPASLWTQGFSVDVLA